MPALSSRLRPCHRPIGRLPFLLALVIVGSLGACLQATSASAASVALVPAFGAGDLGEATTLNVVLTFTGSEYHGSPQPIGEVVVHLPAGVGGSAGFPTCSESVLEASGPSGCPAGSLAGPVGSIAFDREVEENRVITRVHETGTIQPVFADPEEAVEKAELLFYLAAPGLDFAFPAYYRVDTPPYGRVLTLKVPLVESIPAQPFLSFTSFNVTLGASREQAGELMSSLSIPAECPGSGTFGWAADVTFYEAASPTPVTAETACPASSAKHVTTTTLQASATTPTVGEGVTYTATVTPTISGASQPSGSVQFLDAGTPIVGCLAQPLTPGASASTATCQVSYATTGTHQITVSYGGDTGYLGSTSAAQTITVTKEEGGNKGGGSGGGTGGMPVVSCCDGPVKRPFVLLPPPITSAQVVASLMQQLTPSGKTATIPTLRKHGGLTLSYTALEAGTLVMQWWQVPPGAKLARKAKPVLIASGRLTFSGPGTGTVKLTLTAVGRRVLRHAKRLKVEARDTFVPTNGTAVSTSWSFVPRR